MTAYALALASALLYGSGDFFGGLSTRRAPPLLVVALGQSAGLMVLLLIFLAVPSPLPPRADLAWGAVAGLCGGAGVGLLYRALALGTMSVVAPTTAVCAVVVPVLWGVAFGVHPGPHATAGIALAIVAIVLISQPPASDGPMTVARRSGLPAGLGTALASGVLIGGFFLALSRTASDAGLWPLVAARCTSAVCFVAAMAFRRQSWRVSRPTGLLIVTGGILDMLANALYLLAMRGGPLASVVTLSSLYPASTVVLARFVLGERIGAVQMTGVVAAFVAVVLIVSAQ